MGSDVGLLSPSILLYLWAALALFFKEDLSNLGLVQLPYSYN